MDKQFHFKESPQVVFSRDFVSIYILEAHSLLILEWKRQITLPERIEGFNQGLALTHQYQLIRWLIDDMQLYIITEEEKEWVLTEFQENVSQSTLLQLAVVTADFYPALVANTEFTQKGQEGYKAKGKIQHEVFTEYSSALSWLLPDSIN